MFALPISMLHCQIIMFALPIFDTFTYSSDAHGTVLWLDHCIFSHSLHQSIDNINVLYEFSTSDHFRLVISLSCLSLPLFDDRVNASIGAKKINWNKLSSDQKAG